MNFPSTRSISVSRNSGGSLPKKIILVSLVLVLLAPISLFGLTKASAASPSNVTFTSPVNLSADTYQAKYPWVSSSGNYVYVAWTEGSHGVFLRVSNNNGAAGSWTPPLTQAATRLSLKGGTTNYPVMSANGSNIYVAWTQSLVSGGNALTFVAASSNYGASFTTTELSINLTAYSSDTPFIATYGNNAYIIWHAVASNGAASVWVSSTTSSGMKWSTALQLDAKSGQADEPQIAAWGNYVYATWDRNGAWFDVSANNGLTWSTPLNLNTGSGGVPAGNVREPWITASGTNVYVSWNDNSGYGTTNGKIYDPYIMVSNNNGKNWNQNTTPKGAKINLMPGSTSSWEIQDQAVGNSVYVIWRDHTPAYTTNGDDLMISSANAGLTWTPALGTSSPTDVSNDNQITGWSNGIGVSGNTVAIA